MSEKRKDSKGRLLRNGESQRKDGKYEYRYIDVSGTRRSVYSWKLVDTDKLPNGKKPCASLREIEKEIEKELSAGLKTFEIKKLTVNEYFERHMSMKSLNPNTRNLYNRTYDIHIRNTIFGKMLVTSVRPVHVKNLLVDIHKKSNMSLASLQVVQIVLSQMFAAAVNDEHISKNPTTGILKEVSKYVVDDKEPRVALTKGQQENFSRYVMESAVYKKWTNLFTFLLGTGCRIGETLALQWEDCDFDKNIINISRSLSYTKINEKHSYIIGSTKSKTSKRDIPMLAEVRNALLNERERQIASGLKSAEIDGYKNFVFINKYGKPRTSVGVNEALRNIVRSYNACEKRKAEAENREPELLPNISPHIFRHTFCTRFCELERNIKVVQEIMGHSNITTTMMIYNTATDDEKRRSFSSLEGSMQIMSNSAK